MKHKFLTIMACVALGAPLAAQNINQSVQVTNDFVTRFADFQKLGPGLQVPDTLYRFDYDFDYSVFETPYKGSYEFSPYRIEVTPEARLYDGRKLYLRAGAGYTLHPSLELAWQMLQQENFAIGFFAEAGGYAGNYRRRGVEGTFSGHDLSARAGVGGQYLTPGARLSYHFGYEGIFAGEGGENPAFRSAFNSGVVLGRIQSRERPENHLFYDIDLSYRYSGESSLPQSAVSDLGENNLRLALSAGPRLKGKYGFLLDAVFESESLRTTVPYDLSGNRVYGEMFGGTTVALLASVRPHLDFLLGPVRLDAGARLDYTAAEETRFTLNPDVVARLALLDLDLELFAGISGGQAVQSHYAIKQINHFARRSAAMASVSREKVRIYGGLQGHIGSRFQYELEGGYASLAAMPLASLYGVGLADYKEAYGKGRFSWKGERLELDGALAYAYRRFYGISAGYAPPAFTADVRGRYNWEQRAWLGAFVEAASGRMSLAGDDAWMAAYANVGLTGEWRLDYRWTVWAEAGNLLGMAIERVPGFIEKGPYATVGLSLNL
ncbi:MAG: hypothetical protein K6E35_02015 [Bacteroidales bacterium]|nr:hypothetical protein [Bacteroidales bacterium]